VAAWSAAAADDPSSTGPGAYPAAYAIVGAKVIAEPGKVYEPGTIVVRRGVIEAVGPAKEVTVPYDAETIEGKGLVVYPGFIDVYSTVGQRAGVDRSATGVGRPVNLAEGPLATTPPDNRRGLTPEFAVAGVLELTDALAEPRRRQGFTDLVSAPGGAIATGQSALVSLSGLPRRESIIAAPVALHINLAPPFEPAGAGPPRTETPQPVPGQPPGRRRGFGEQAGPTENPYPRSLMGTIAHLRQAMLDADHLQKLDAYLEVHGGPQPPFDPALKALQAARSKKLAVWWEANSRDEIHRALDLAQEFGTSAVIVGGREAAKVADRLKAAKAPVILRLNVPEEPRVPSQTEYRKRAVAERDDPLRVLAHRKARWNEQLAAAAALAKAGIAFAFATDGIDRLESIPVNLRHYVHAGLSADQALAALTKDAAAIAGVQRRLGTLEPGKLGHLIVMTAPFTEESAKVRYVLIDGLKFEIKPEDRARAKGRAGEGGGPPTEGRETAEKSRPGPEGRGLARTAKKAEGPPTAAAKDAPSQSAQPAQRKAGQPDSSAAVVVRRQPEESPGLLNARPASPTPRRQWWCVVSRKRARACSRKSNNSRQPPRSRIPRQPDQTGPSSSRPRGPRRKPAHPLSPMAGPLSPRPRPPRPRHPRPRPPRPRHPRPRRPRPRQPGPRLLRLSTSPPSSKRTASRPSTPAAMC
jgi:imidazolonepropionase-like amidohydrolase